MTPASYAPANRLILNRLDFEVKMLGLSPISKKIEHQSGLKQYHLWLLWGFVIALAMLPRLFDLNVFYARDELTIWRWSDQFTLAVWDGNLAGTLTRSDYPGIPMFWAQTLFLTFKYSFPALFPQTMVPVEQISEFRGPDFLAERRLVAALFVGLQIIAAVWLVRRLFGWPIAVLSAIFLALDPFALSEARVLRLQMVSAMFVGLSTLAYFLYLRQRRRWYLLWSGIMGGLAASSQVSAGFLVPYIWLLLLLDFLFGSAPGSDSAINEGRRKPWLDKFRQLIVNGLLWAAGAVGTFYVIWPALWIKPLEAMRIVLEVGFTNAAQTSIWNGPVFFWGRVMDEDPGLFFYPVAFAFRTTPLAWIGLASALVVLVAFTWRGLTNRGILPAPAFAPGRLGSDQIKVHRPGPTLWSLPWPIAAIILLLAQIVLITAELSATLSKVDRYLLTVFPALNILSAIGIYFLGQWVLARVPRISDAGRNRLGVAALAIVLGIQLSFSLPAHPYYFTYWNPWTGGGQAAMDTLPVGAGEGIDLAMAFLNRQPDADQATVVCGASQPWCSYLFNGKTVRSATYFDGTWVEANYASFYISQRQRQLYPAEVVDFFGQKPPLYQVDLGGATYVWVYAVPEITHFAGPANDLTGLARLLGYDLVPEIDPDLVPGTTVKATVLWTNRGAGVSNLVLRMVDQTGYELARSRVVPEPDYASIPPDQNAIVQGVASLTIPPGTPPGPYYWRIGVLAPNEDRLLGEFSLPADADQLWVTSGQSFTDPNLFAIANPVDQPLAAGVKLLGYVRPDQVLTAERPTWLTLYWQATAVPDDYLVDLRLLDDRGREVTHWQGRPGYGTYPTRLWQTGEIVRDVWSLQVSPDIPIGQYNLEISLLNIDQPETLSAASSRPSPNFRIRNVEVWSQPVNYDVPDMQVESQAQFGDDLTLLGYDLFLDADGAGGLRLAPVFYWQSQAELQVAFDLVLTLEQASDGLVLNTWRVPLGSSGEKTAWKAKEIVETPYGLDVLGSLNAANTSYHLDLALQNKTTGLTVPVKRPGQAVTGTLRLENIQDQIVVRRVGN